MDATNPNSNSPTVRSPVSPIYGSNEKTEVTVFVLLTGILAGLLLVVIVLCICKCCVKTSKPLKRQQVVFTKYSSERDNTWNGKDTSTCTKYHSMEPRSSPSFSVPIDVEVGYVEGVALTTAREPEDRLLEVSTLTPSNVRTPGGRVFPDCSRELSPKKSPEESPVVQFPFVPRSPEEIRIYKSRRFPRSPPIQRQSSICLPNSDEHLDRYLSDKMEEGGESSQPPVALASPEESSSFEESNCEEKASTALAATVSKRETCRVSAEIHQAPRSVTEDDYGSPGLFCTQPPADSTLYFQRCILKAPASVQLSTRSLEAEIGISERKKRPASSPEERHLRPASASDVRSGEWLSDLDQEQCSSTDDDMILGKMLEVRCRQNSLLLQVRHSVAQLSDEDEEPKSKVRYNDTGSMEEVNDEALDFMGTPEVAEEQVDPDENDMIQVEGGESDAEELQRQLLCKVEEPITLQYRQIWELRATFEEEDDDDEEEDANGCVPQTVEEAAAIGHCCSQEPAVASPSNTESPEMNISKCVEESTELVLAESLTSQDSVMQPEIETGDESDCPAKDGQSGCSHSALPTQEARRQSYKNILSKRVKKLESKGGGSEQQQQPPADNSFDSVETEESSTDASRLEVVTTSMESTTDNTDSTGEGQIHRLQQMKADSGYKSLETNGNTLKSVKKQIHFVLEDDGGIEVMDTEEQDSQEGSDWVAGGKDLADTLNLPVAGTRRKEKFAPVRRHPNGKTASKKRREYTRERQVVESSFGSVTEFETDSTRSDQLSGQESLDEAQGKASVFLRFFRTPRERPARPFVRDFSIDEKSDTLFREFSRRDPTLELNSRSRSPRLHSRHRLYHRHMESSDGMGSPRHARSKLSPQDSIEEEEQHSRCGELEMDLSRGMAHIPIIKVAGEDSS